MPRAVTGLLMAVLAVTACQPIAPTTATGTPSAHPSASPTPAAPVSPVGSASPPGPTPPAATATPTPTAPTPGPSPSARLRTYSSTIKPITSSQNCKTCHATGPGVSYEFDASRKATIVRMAETNGPRVGLTSQQIADVRAWFEAGAPNDPTPF